jgi:hypothetical protein
MNKKILSLVLTFLSFASFAETETFQASVTPIANLLITEDVPLQFGEITFLSGSTCTIDLADTLTAGDCSAANITPTTGVINVAGLVPASGATVTVTGSTENDLTLVATGQITGSIATPTNFADNVATPVTTTAGAAPEFDLLIGGTITANADLTVDGTPLTVSYDVTVTVP